LRAGFLCVSDVRSRSNWAQEREGGRTEVLGPLAQSCREGEEDRRREERGREGGRRSRRRDEDERKGKAQGRVGVVVRMVEALGEVRCRGKLPGRGLRGRKG